MAPGFRTFWTLTAPLLLFCALPAFAQTIALTFDDGPKMADTVRMGAAEKNVALLDALKEAGVQAALFVNAKDSSPERLALIRKWGEAGHMIGNHTATHPSLSNSKVSLQDFEKDVLDCDAVIRGMPGFAKRFRFPFLKEGDTKEKRDGFRAFLKSIGYKPAPVSVDASDWYYNQRLSERLAKEPGADLSAYRAAYLDHLWDRACYYEGLAKSVLGRSPKHVLLLHHNLINALFVGDVIRMFRAKGWTVVSAKSAFEDPVYALEPAVLPAGESLLWSLAKAKGVEGLRFPGEDDVYEKPILDKLGL